MGCLLQREKPLQFWLKVELKKKKLKNKTKKPWQAGPIIFRVQARVKDSIECEWCFPPRCELGTLGKKTLYVTAPTRIPKQSDLENTFRKLFAPVPVQAIAYPFL